MKEELELINQLCSGDRDVKDYIKDHEEILTEIDKLDKIVDEAKIKTIEDFKFYYKVKGLASSLFCYTFNNNKQEYDRVSELENKLGKKLYNLAKSYGKIKDREVRILAKYVCLERYYMQEDREKIINKLLENRVIRKKEDGFYIVGLHYKVGDNTFTVGNNGREYRNFVNVCSIQAFPISRRFNEILKTKNVPELNEKIYSITGIGDYKHCANIKFPSWKEAQIITHDFLLR